MAKDVWTEEHSLAENRYRIFYIETKRLHLVLENLCRKGYYWLVGSSVYIFMHKLLMFPEMVIVPEIISLQPNFIQMHSPC